MKKYIKCIANIYIDIPPPDSPLTPLIVIRLHRSCKKGQNLVTLQSSSGISACPALPALLELNTQLENKGERYDVLEWENKEVSVGSTRFLISPLWSHEQGFSICHWNWSVGTPLLNFLFSMRELLNCKCKTCPGPLESSCRYWSSPLTSPTFL